MTLFKLSSAPGWNYTFTPPLIWRYLNYPQLPAGITFTPPLLWRYLNYPQLPTGIILLLRHSYDVI